MINTQKFGFIKDLQQLCYLKKNYSPTSALFEKVWGGCCTLYTVQYVTDDANAKL